MNGTANYATCDESCSEHEDKHVHFNCTACLNVYYLDELYVPKLSMPQGFTTANVTLIVYGICEKCNKKVEEFIKKQSLIVAKN